MLSTALGKLTLRLEDVFLRFLAFVGGAGPAGADGELIVVLVGRRWRKIFLNHGCYCYVKSQA